MAIKPIYTEYGDWTGLRFELSGEATFAQKIATSDDVQRVLVSLPPDGDGWLLLTPNSRAVLLAAMKLYWTDLGRIASERNPDKPAADSAPVRVGSDET